MRIIDAHTHIFAPEVAQQRERFFSRDRWFQLLYANPRARLATADELVTSLNKAGIERAITFGFAWADPGLCRMANDYVLEMTRRFPDRLIGFAVVNPRCGEAAPQAADRCVALGCRGIGELMPDGQGYLLNDRQVMDELLRWLAQRHLPLLVHSNEPVGHEYSGKGDSTPAVIYRMAQQHPELTLICAHWGGGLLFYELMPEVQQVLRNTYYDTAASLYLYDKRIFALAAQICREKILFATDYPLIQQERFLQHVREAALPSAVLSDIMGGNVARLLGLSD